jgi:hypothetical protein
MDGVAQSPVRADGHRWEPERTWKSKGRYGHPRKWMTLWRCSRCGRRKRQDHLVNARRIGPLDAPPAGLPVYEDRRPRTCGELLVREVMES